MQAVMATAVIGWGRRESEGVWRLVKSIEEGGGCRGEGDERTREIGGQRAFHRGEVGGRRWKKALTGGSHV
jgi:hypothetical protein